MNDLLRPALYQAFHRIEPVRRDARHPRSASTWWAPSARRATSWPATASCRCPSPGDLLAVRDAGAYAFSMASNYNLRLRPAEALVEDGEVRLIRRRETFDDLVRTEV